MGFYCTTVNPYSDPTDHNSTQIKFSFKGLDGDNEMPREILGWCRNVERVLRDSISLLVRPSITWRSKFMRGSGLSSFESAAMVFFVGRPFLSSLS